MPEAVSAAITIANRHADEIPGLFGQENPTA
jgi:hypothetical protein